MNLRKKRQLASRVLDVGMKRIWFDSNRLNEIKEAITAQDIRDLFKSKAIEVKQIAGRKNKRERNTRRKQGKIKKSLNMRKKNYIFLVRKLRKHLKLLRKQKKISRDIYNKLRREAKSGKFKNKQNMMEEIENESSAKAKKKTAKN